MLEAGNKRQFAEIEFPLREFGHRSTAERGLVAPLCLSGCALVRVYEMNHLRPKIPSSPVTPVDALVEPV
jgi:hypothetical protein